MSDQLPAPDAISALSGPPDVSSPTAQPPLGISDAAAAMSGGPAPNVSAPPVMPTQQKPNLWQNVLIGTISGLANSAGSSSFGGGLAAGAAGELKRQQNDRLYQMAQQEAQSQWKFRDVQAAHMLAETTLKHAQIEALPGQMKQQTTQNGLEQMRLLQSMGLTPTMSIPNTDAHAIAAMQQMTDVHGSIPSIFTIDIGGKLVGYDLNQLTSNDGSNLLDAVNKYGAVLGRPEISKQQWAQIPQGDKISMVSSTFNALNVVPDPSKVEMQLATAQNQLASYRDLPEWKRDPAIADRLQKNVDFLKTAAAQFDNHAIVQAGRKKAAEAAAEESAKSAANSKAEGSIGPDVFGFTPKLPPDGIKGYTQLQRSFKRNVDDLNGTEQTYQQFANVLSDIDAGKDVTGARSVVALFNAIGLSGEGLKGKGFRISNNVVEEHANARGLGENLYQKLLRLKEGDVITPRQIQDYANIAATARESKIITLINEIHNQGLNADFAVPAGNGQHLDKSTAKIFLQLSGGNKDLARSAAQKKGWSF